jgi:predicted RNA binding protein YcfA (HicA-like mRNA interferase family)
MKLPVVSGVEAAAAFGKAGYAVDRQRGSHILLRQQQPPHRRLSAPDRKGPAKGTLRSLLHEAGLSVEEFAKLL